MCLDDRTVAPCSIRAELRKLCCSAVESMGRERDIGAEGGALHWMLRLMEFGLASLW